MKKVAIIADSHFEEMSRFDECIRIHSWIADDIAAREVDLVLHSGDVYERKSTPKERYAVAQWVQRITDHCAMVIVRGNHDALGDLGILRKLDTRSPVFVIEDAQVVCFGGFVIGCLAWPSKASVLAMGAESHAEGELLAGEAMQNVLRGLGGRMEAQSSVDEHDGTRILPRILLAHAMVRGSVTSTGQPLVGCDLEVGIDDLSLAGADLYALGHVHKGQDWDRAGSPFVYPGSPRRANFGELEAKGYVVATFDGPRLVGWERIETPCAKMFLVEDEWGDDEGKVGWLVGMHGMPAWRDVAGSEFKIRYTVTADMRDAARAAADHFKQRLLEGGAVNVKVEDRVVPVNSQRAPEVARAVTLADKLGAYWTARGTTPEADRASRLMDKAQQLESEAARAV